MRYLFLTFFLASSCFSYAMDDRGHTGRVQSKTPFFKQVFQRVQAIQGGDTNDALSEAVVARTLLEMISTDLYLGVSIASWRPVPDILRDIIATLRERVIGMAQQIITIRNNLQVSGIALNEMFFEGVDIDTFLLVQDSFLVMLTRSYSGEGSTAWYDSMTLHEKLKRIAKNHDSILSVIRRDYPQLKSLLKPCSKKQVKSPKNCTSTSQGSKYEEF